MSPKTIFVVDDDLNVREGLEAFLCVEFEVRCFESAESFLAVISNATPHDCLLLDLRMPKLNGFDLQSALSKIGYSTPIIFMSGDADKADVIAAWREGAVDFVLKPFSAEQILSSIKKVVGPQPPESSDNRANLTNLSVTRREAQVLVLLGRGFKQQEVAQQLNITLRTVKMYRALLKDKLNLHSVGALTRFYDLHKQTLECKVQDPKR